jgi:hypothetical protein
LTCVDCFTQVTNDIKAPFQVYNLQVLPSAKPNTVAAGALSHIKVRNQDGFTALIAAAAGGHLECVRLLVDHGADVHKGGPVRVGGVHFEVHSTEDKIECSHNCRMV